MPLNSFSNGGYEKVSMLDEFDENENGFNKSPTAETKANGNHAYSFEFSVSVPLCSKILPLN